MNETWILSKFDKLVNSGLVFYDENQETVQHVDGELEFQFLLTSALVKKPVLGPPSSEKNAEVNGGKADGSDISTKGFEIGPIGNDHFVIANKFCYARPHLMLLTCDGYRRQYEPLDEAGLEAAQTVLLSMSQDFVVFYNCGQDGGCSRLHKHMQLIPKPPHSFADFLDNEASSSNPPKVPFHWFYQRIDVANTDAKGLTEVYTNLLQQATAVGQGLAQHADSAPPGAACPHNFIMSKRWMIVIPRRRAGINKEAGANALGMLGVIAVATRAEIDNWIRLGLSESLRELGVPK
ncbi:Diadenosine 5',5'''-P1,P4-tetraphosphate phosphorylase 2 [Trichoderma lentiforme]|uniref:Diadenosine 5',5'''-P1,P4-tetraphosphate phosphorylase 2 n=1 Tax=Trichoderma lentiforme TaxID=1567552 RepID=A0A9P4X7K6_9HYPO|nr:Diadenosine 5',5'''-P1,P4-tetraphosphate phosphorylase 2 [Trichoderma lentiforme]